MNSANNEKNMFDKVTDVITIIVAIAFVGLLIWAFYAGNSDSDYDFSHLYKSSYSSGSSYSSRSTGSSYSSGSSSRSYGGGSYGGGSYSGGGSSRSSGGGSYSGGGSRGRR